MLRGHGIHPAQVCKPSRAPKALLEHLLAGLLEGLEGLGVPQEVGFDFAADFPDKPSERGLGEALDVSLFVVARHMMQVVGKVCFSTYQAEMECFLAMQLRLIYFFIIIIYSKPALFFTDSQPA